MTDAKPKIRLFVEALLGVGTEVQLDRDKAHYLFGVMRLGEGAQVALFNGQDGEWAAEVSEAGKRGGVLVCQRQTAEQRNPPDLWLLFAPIKKARTDFIVEKAAELGAARVQPVFTRFTNAERVRPDRLRAHAIEAAEQCGGTFVPEVLEPVKLDALLSDWPADRRILFCDESQTGRDALSALREAPKGPWAILIGPEGGFALEEAERLRGMELALPVTLGPRILRADTAAVAAMTLWQAALGDWE
jgi:16S rRNA (uracil1498-N3)-methyltransferase